MRTSCHASCLREIWTNSPICTLINVRDVPHGAFTVTGDKTLKLLAVHVVDKGKPLYIPAKP